MCTSVGVPKEASDGHEIPLPDMGAGNQALALGRSSKCSPVIKSSLQPLSVIWMSFSHQLCISCVPVRFWFHTKKPPPPPVHLPQLVSVAVIKTKTQSNAGRRGLVPLPALRSITGGARAGTTAEPMEDYGLLCLLFYFSQDHGTIDITAHSGPSLSTSITKKCPTFSQLRFLLR